MSACRLDLAHGITHARKMHHHLADARVFAQHANAVARGDDEVSFDRVDADRSIQLSKQVLEFVKERVG